MQAENVAPILDVLAKFDAVFAVLEDRDDAVTKLALEWAEREQRMHEASPELVARYSLTEDMIERQIAERNAARKARDFARADGIRQELAAKGILLEDSPDDVRWRRK